MPHLHHFPAWTDSNPYTNMLHLGIRARGWDISGTIALDRLLEALPSLVQGDVFHIQWTQTVLKSARNPREAKEALARFREGVQQAQQKGVFVVWTVHNKLPHDLRFREAEIELANFLGDVADRIIQLTPYTADAVSDAYSLPVEKLVTLRHASYVGIYGEPIPQAEARAELGVPLSSPTVGFVGQIRPYKGVLTLFEALDRLSRRVEDVTLLLAGKTAPHEAEVLEAQLPRRIRAVRRNGFLPDGDIATWFSAADVMAFPYRNILNSGSLLLAATYGRPAILPAEPHLVSEYGNEDWVGFYDPGEGSASRLAMTLERSLKTSRRSRHSASAFADKYTTYDMASGFLSILNEMMECER